MSRPIIGLTSNLRPAKGPAHGPQLCLQTDYLDAVFAAGGMPRPLPLPPESDDDLLDELLAGCQGVLFTGGYDLPPELYGQEPHPRTQPLPPRRGRLEINLFRRADEAGLPILAICLGHQVAHVARGGRLVQHVDDLPRRPAVTHYLPDETSTFHPVQIEPESRLAKVVGGTTLEVNSRHHQVVDPEPAPTGLRPVAWSPDGVIEAYEATGDRFLLTVQWHPENLFDRAEHLRLFAALVAAAEMHARRPGAKP